MSYKFNPFTGNLDYYDIGPAGATTFLALTDTPDTYVGNSLRGLRVNVGETALEFYVPTDLDRLVGVDAAATPGFLGDTGLNGVLRVGAGISHTDGGDFVTLANSDTGSAAVAAHNLAYVHGDIALNTAARHAAATVLDSVSVDFTIVGQQITADVLPAGVDHNSLSNYSANRHIDHTTVSISAGGILSGGGDISANRTITLANGDIDHNSLNNYSANRHVDHTAVSISAGTGLTGGGDISANRTISLSHLGIESLIDPGAHRLWGWDDTDGSIQWIVIGSNLTYDHPTHTLSAAGAAATDFLSLTDTPNTYVGSGGYLVRVNATPDALEFVSKDGLISLNELSDVVISAPAVDEVLRYNGTNWINGPSPVAGATAGEILFLDDDTTTGANGALLSNPDTATGTVTDNIVTTSATSPVFGEGYLWNETTIGETTIPSGIWEFDFYAYVSGAGGVTQIGADILKSVSGAGTVTITGAGTSRTATVTGGTPFVAGDANAAIRTASYLMTPNGTFQITAFTSSSVVTIATDVGYANESGVVYSVQRKLFGADSGEIDNTTVQLHTFFSAQASFTVNASDKLAMRTYGITTSVAAITISLEHNGTTSYSHIHTPLSGKHNDLAGLQGGTSNEYYHLTSAEYSGLHVPVTVLDSASVDFTLAGQQITAAVLPAGVDHNSLNNYSANRHIDHSAVSISAGTGLTGGGDITSTRTLSLSHLGIQNLTDPNADRIYFWDDSSGFTDWLVVSTGLAITDTNLTLSHLGIQNLSDPNADRVMFWDDSSGYVDWLTISTGLSITATNITTNDSQIVHNNLSGYVANEHINHTSVSISAGTGLTGGGDISANRTLSLSHLGIQNLADPNADRILFWDDSATATDWLAIGTGLNITTTTISFAHLGIENLTDPNAHRLMLWDDTDGSVQWVTIGTNLTYTQATHTLSASGGGSGSSMVRTITQASHTFVAGDVLRWDTGGANYTKAKADTAANAEVVGIVTSVSGNDFDLLIGGYISTLSGLTAGTVYFLSDSTAGLLTATEPTTATYISKPLLIAVSTTAGYFFNMRGKVIGTSTFGASSSQAFTSSGNWVCPTGVTRARITLIGGGGGGAGGVSATRGGVGGSGAGAIIERIFTVVPTTSYAITIGTGGAGGAAGLSGSDGTDSTFATLGLTAQGGKGGVEAAPMYMSGGGQLGGGTTNQYGTGGSYATTDAPGGQYFNFPGGCGGYRSATLGAGGGGVLWYGVGGNGGTASQAGQTPASGYGGGGGGGSATAAYRAGGAGANGYCLVEW